MHSNFDDCENDEDEEDAEAEEETDTDSQSDDDYVTWRMNVLMKGTRMVDPCWIREAIVISAELW